MSIIKNLSMSDFITICSVLGALISLFINFLQFIKKRELNKDLYQTVLTQYNNYYSIARAITKINNLKENNNEVNEIKEIYDNNLNYVRGIADSARLQLMNFSKTQLKKDVFYQHPAYPDKTEFSDKVMMGMPPEKEKDIQL